MCKLFAQLFERQNVEQGISNRRSASKFDLLRFAFFYLSDCRRNGLFERTALFILLAATAVTGVVPADSRLSTAKWLIQNSSIDKGPGSGLSAENGQLVVLDRLLFLGIGRDKLDAPLRILFCSVDCFDDLKTLPLGFFGPFARALTVEFRSGAGMMGPLDEIDVCRDVSRIPRAH